MEDDGSDLGFLIDSAGPWGELPLEVAGSPLLKKRKHSQAKIQQPDVSFPACHQAEVYLVCHQIVQ